MAFSFTVCVPAYQAERYLAETLACVRAQHYAEWELVVTEDGSRDGTEALVRAFAATVSQPVRYERHDPNRGLPATRNAAIANVKTEWLALLDSDDLWLPDHLADLARTIGRTNADLVHSGSVLFESDSGRDLELRRPDEEAVRDFPRSLFSGRYIIQPASVALRRSLWERAGHFDPSFRYVEDWDMWLRCARAGGKFAYTGNETCRYRKHSAALSTHSVPMALACARALEKHLNWEELPAAQRRDAVARMWAAAGQMSLRSEPRQARRYYDKALSYRSHPDWWLRRLLAIVMQWRAA